MHSDGTSSLCYSDRSKTRWLVFVRIQRSSSLWAFRDSCITIVVRGANSNSAMGFLGDFQIFIADVHRQMFRKRNMLISPECWLRCWLLSACQTLFSSTYVRRNSCISISLHKHFYFHYAKYIYLKNFIYFHYKISTYCLIMRSFFNFYF